MNSFQITRVQTLPQQRTTKTRDRHKQVWRIRYDENSRRWNKRTKSQRHRLLSSAA